MPTQPIFVVGLTGGIGAGKTTITNLFQTLGTPVLDADIIARQLVEPGQPLVEKIAAHFGHQILTEHGAIKRKILREIVFQQTEGRQWLENLLHPKIRAHMQQKMALMSGDDYCILSMPLLLETRQQDLVDRILVVDLPTHIQLARVQQRDKLTQDEIKRIVEVQLSREERLTHADDVLSNLDPVDGLTHAVQALHEKYLQMAQNRHT